LLVTLVWLILNLADNLISWPVVLRYPQAELNIIYQLTGSFAIATIAKFTTAAIIPLVLWKMGAIKVLWLFCLPLGVILVSNVIFIARMAGG